MYFNRRAFFYIYTWKHIHTAVNLNVRDTDQYHTCACTCYSFFPGTTRDRNNLSLPPEQDLPLPLTLTLQDLPWESGSPITQESAPDKYTNNLFSFIFLQPFKVAECNGQHFDGGHLYYRKKKMMMTRAVLVRVLPWRPEEGNSEN